MRWVLHAADKVALTGKKVNFTDQQHIRSLLSIYYYNEYISYVICPFILQTYLTNSECRSIKLAYTRLNKPELLSTKVLEVHMPLWRHYINTYFSF
jgi:hypothetical protein